MLYQPKSPDRLVSLDVFRGLAVAGMIMVNNPGSWQHVHPLLRHAAWEGCRPADLIFPFFLFILGASLYLSHSRGAGGQGSCGRILRRAITLFALGVLLNCGTEILVWLNTAEPNPFAHMRIMGVLQRIGLTYCMAGLLIRNVSHKTILTISAVVLMTYWGILAAIPVPGYGAGDLKPEGCLAAYLDRLVLTNAHMYRGGPVEPEGLLATFPATVTVLTGYGASRWIVTRRPCGAVAVQLLLAGVGCIAIGRIWALVFPINKALWTSSFVAYSTGWALVVMAICYAMIELEAWRRCGRPLEVLGRNSILVYVGASLLIRILLELQVPADPMPKSLLSMIYEELFAAWAGPVAGSLGFALAYLALWWLIAWGLYWRALFIRV